MKTRILLLFLLLAGTARAQTTSSYIGPDGDVWSDPANWSPMVMPNNGGGMNFDVTIDGLQVQLDVDVTVSGFNLDSVGGRLTDNEHSFAAANTAVGNGRVELIGHGTVDLGNLADFSDHTLHSGDIRVDADTPGQMAKVKFNGADIVNGPRPPPGPRGGLAL